MAKGTATLPGIEPALPDDVKEAALKLFDLRANVTAAQGKAKAQEKVVAAVMEENGLRHCFEPETNISVDIEESERIVVKVGEKKVGKAKAVPKEAPARLRGEAK